MFSGSAKAFCLLTVLLAGLLVGSPVARAQIDERPNLIVILTDDLSDDLMRVMLTAGHAPNIKQYLNEGGVVFRNSFVTNSQCCPSRATFLTGQYAHNHRVLSNRSGPDGSENPGILWPGWFPEGETPGRNASTVATWLRTAGYTTGHIGRYLAGYGLAAPEGEPDPKLYIPPGWDDWQGLIDPTTFQVYDYEINDNGTLEIHGSEEADYQTDVLADRAVEFIDERAANQERFFLSIATFAPHVEVLASSNRGPNFDRLLDLTIRPAPRHAHLIDGDDSNGELPPPVLGAAFNEGDISDKPSCPRHISPSTNPPICVGDLDLLDQVDDVPRLVDQYKAMMAAMIAVDDLVGAVMDSLIANGLDGQTVIMFTSDNGWMVGEHRMIGKQLAYEESIHVPLLVRGPGFASHVIASQIVLNNDLAPTLAELAGATPTHELDGTSLVPILEMPEGGGWHRKGFLVEHWFIPETGFAQFFAVRYLASASDFLYVETRADSDNPGLVTHREFYDLTRDPDQLRSIDVNGARLAEHLLSLRLCAGETCRARETARLR